MPTTLEEAAKRIFFALDVTKLHEALAFIKALSHLVAFKIGLEILSGKDGPALVRALTSMNAVFFQDMKLHDIPETVKRAAKNQAEGGASFLTVHALGGTQMMRAAIEGARAGNPNTKVLAITVLTSHTVEDLREIGLLTDHDSLSLDRGSVSADTLVRAVVMRLARLAYKAGCDGVVASPHEASLLRAEFGSDFLIVTPGIRSPDAPADDQKRTATAEEAIAMGADHVVIGRPIRNSPNPALTTAGFAMEIRNALTRRAL